MGCQVCRPAVDSCSLEIEKQLKTDRFLQEKTIKILLLGTADSGKSTIVKQMRHIYISKTDPDELRLATNQVFQNVRVIFHEVAKAILDLYRPSPEAQEVLSRFSTTDLLEMDVDWTIERESIEEFSQLGDVQDFMEKHKFYRTLPDNATYFWERIPAILESNFVASEQDTVHLRTPTYGIHEIKFKFKLGNIRLIDVGGQRAERRKWIHCFEGVTAVMFVASMASYDQELEECATTNRLAEAISLFFEVFRNRWLAASGFLLFLNKFDLFESKIAFSPISSFYPNYDGGRNIHKAADFIHDLFTMKIPPDDMERRGFHAHFTTAVDPENIDFVFKGAMDIILNTDLNKRVYNHRPGKCQIVEGILHGAEHIEYVESGNFALISSGLQLMSDMPGRPGQIFLYDLKEKSKRAIPLKILDEPYDFHPHGMSHFVEKTKIFLYAISHTTMKNGFRHSVELFELNEKQKTLKHLKTIRHETIFRPNAIYALGMDRFFVTNDGRAQKGFLNLIELLFSLPTGDVVFFDKQEIHPIVTYEITPNGIWVDEKERILYYASHLGKFVKALRLSDDFKSSTELLGKADLLTAPDNLFLDAQGYLWSGAHPIFHKILDNSRCFTRELPQDQLPPSQVLRLKFSEDFTSFELTEPYTDDGKQISCSASAIHDGKGNMLIGSVGTNLLHCAYTEETVQS
ncbi:unnamed protein product, partial [Mesorhabditis belari]|uniref:Uncharacterized protein n=1 Tax=Mesorhabditis belari TaxID=2138241 RepID=A0AAF3FBM8_9BILA